MLIKVVKSRLVLGRSVYQRGDVFECPPNESQMMIAIGLVQVAPQGTVVNREPPRAPRGLSLTQSTQPVSYMPTRARRIGASRSQSGEQS